MSQLYIVSTPIGNLGDITYRAVQVLSAVHRVLAEDTRRTSILLRHYSITTPLVSAHAHNEEARSEQILGWLDAGQDLALVSDAGTPLLSDPGARIVQRVIAGGHDIVPVPGPSALLACLVASGLDNETFTFFGFIARSGQARAVRLAQIATLQHTAVVYEAPTRIARLVTDLAKVCGPDRRVAVGRELTKLHEEFFRGTLVDAQRYYEDRVVRGEVVLALEGASSEAAPVDREDAHSLAVELLRGGDRPSTVARELARRLSLPRREAYDIALTAAAEAEGEGE
jgi:16S rRNA (cytidine1402-2'-O)-methyltransferase